MKELRNSQPGLCDFIEEFNYGLDDKVQNFAEKIFLNIYSIFTKAANNVIVPIAHDKILNTYVQVESLMENLNENDDFKDRVDKFDLYVQQYVMNQVLDSLLGASNQLSGQEMNFLFMQFKTVVDVLNDSI